MSSANRVYFYGLVGGKGSCQLGVSDSTVHIFGEWRGIPVRWNRGDPKESTALSAIPRTCAPRHQLGGTLRWRTRGRGLPDYLFPRPGPRALFGPTAEVRSGASVSVTRLILNFRRRRLVQEKSRALSGYSRRVELSPRRVCLSAGGKYAELQGTSKETLRRSPFTEVTSAPLVRQSHRFKDIYAEHPSIWSFLFATPLRSPNLSNDSTQVLQHESKPAGSSGVSCCFVGTDFQPNGMAQVVALVSRYSNPCPSHDRTRDEASAQCLRISPCTAHLYR